MTNDEKAKAYDKALEQAKFYHGNCPSEPEKKKLEKMFPALRESEDERIRKWLADYFSSIKKTVWIHRDITCEQILAYIEKQKEQKPIGGIYWHAIKKGEKLPCRAYVWNRDFEKYPDCWEGRLIPNLEKICVGIDTWYLPAKDVRDLPREGIDELPEEQKEQKPAWSEEDQLNLNWVIAILNGEPCDLDIQLESLISWLKSLRPSWKPSEEQIRCFDMVLCDEAMDENVHSVLVQLREQLKRLMQP